MIFIVLATMYLIAPDVLDILNAWVTINVRKRGIAQFLERVLGLPLTTPTAPLYDFGAKLVEWAVPRFR